MPSTAPASQAAARAAPPLEPPPYYVPLPRGLAEDLRASPVAIGAYCLIGRLYRVTRAPVPLSPGDLQVLDPRLSYGAATRALRRLADSPYVVVTRAPGRKSRYTPAWGLVRGAPLPWDLAAPCLGRPRHVAALRLDQRMLDTCLGRLRPHGEHPAIVERYVAAPLLGLEEIGVYGTALAGVASSCERLCGLGLLSVAGRPLSLPDDATLLALASQHGLDAPEREGGLTAAGWVRAGFAPAHGEAAGPGQALFFVPPDQIGAVIAPVIAHPISQSQSAPPASALSGRQRARHTERTTGSHGAMESQGIDPTTLPDAGEQAGGGLPLCPKGPMDTPLSPPRAAQPRSGLGEPERPDATSESYGLLRSIGVRRSVAAQLAPHLPALVTQIIAQARARPDVRDLAGWVVSALRELPAGEPPRPAPPKLTDKAILLHPGLTHAERVRWLTRFRNAEPADRPAVLERFSEEHPYEQHAA